MKVTPVHETHVLGWRNSVDIPVDLPSGMSPQVIITLYIACATDLLRFVNCMCVFIVWFLFNCIRRAQVGAYDDRA